MQKKCVLFVLMMAFTFVLVACNQEKSKSTEGKEVPTVQESEFDFPLEVTGGTIEEDGSLVYGIVLSNPFEGTMSRPFYGTTVDRDIMDFFDEPLLATDENLLISNDGPATYELSKDNRTITLTIRKGLTWHDGEPVKASDLLYAYEVLSHPEYNGTQYSYMISNVEGAEAYKNGEADSITGIKVDDEKRQISITYVEATPSVLSGIWTYALPRHYYGDVTKGEVTMEEIESSDAIRKQPIGFGPYRVTKVINGESVMYERNEDYWRGKPALQSLVFKVFSPEIIANAFQKGEVDIAQYPFSQYDAAKELKNINFVGRVGDIYDYTAFKLGKWDMEKRENIMDPQAKLADARVRRAIGHAMDTESVATKLYNGLMVPATTAIPPSRGFHDETNEGISFDPELAKKLLDEAGWVDRDGDGFRENAQGEKVVLTYAAMTGSEVLEPIAQHYIQNWADVGLQVELLDGRLHEYLTFYDMLESDAPGIDIYSGGWSIGTDVDPSNYHGKNALYNFTRYVSDKNDELLNAGISEKAFDVDYRTSVYNEWQKLMQEEAWMVPTLYRYDLFALNQRVTQFSLIEGSENNQKWKWAVTEKEAIK